MMMSHPLGRRPLKKGEWFYEGEMEHETLDDEEEGGKEGGDSKDNAARLARLARKAESARLARLRHKQFVQDKQAEVQALQREEECLLAEEEPASAVALETVRQELRQALSPEQLQVSSPCSSNCRTGTRFA